MACAPGAPGGLTDPDAPSPPPPPSDLAIVDRGPTHIELAWSAPAASGDAVEGYRVYRDGEIVGTPSSTSFRDTGLEPGTEYAYRTSSVDASGREGPTTPELRVSTREPEDGADETPPSVPLDVKAVVVSPTEVELTWIASDDPESGVSFYRIFRDGDAVGSRTTTTFRDTGLEPARQYRYRVSAVNGDGLESGKSPELSVSTPDTAGGGDVTPPSAPAGLQATPPSPTEMDLAWTAAVDPESGVSFYRVFRDGAVVGTPSSATFRDTGLAPATQYVYEVSAVNGDALESARSPRASATTPDDPPTVPQGLRATDVGATEVVLAWTASSDPQTGVELYRVYRDGSLRGTSTSTTFRDTGLAPATSYVYEVSAVNGEGLESGRGPQLQVTTQDDPPTVPQNLQAPVVEATEVELAWAASSDPQTGVSFYRVYRDGALVGAPASTTFRDTGLTPATSYAYEVSAVNGEGLESARGPQLQVTTVEDPPTVPQSLQAADVEATEVELTWSPSTDPQTGVSSYRVYRDGSRVGSPTSTTFRDTGLTPATSYLYEVSAVNGDGLESARSSPLTVTTLDDTPPSAPRSLRAVDVQATEVELSWLASADPETGVASYRVYRDGALVGSPSSTGFRDTGLTPATSYVYEVSAVNGDGLESAVSPALAVTTGT